MNRDKEKLKKELKAITVSLNNSQLKVEELDKDIKDRNKFIEDSNELIAGGKKVVVSLNKTISNLNNKVDSKNNELSDLGNIINARNEELEILENKKTALDVYILDNSKEVEKREVELSKKLEALKTKAIQEVKKLLV